MMDWLIDVIKYLIVIGFAVAIGFKFYDGVKKRKEAKKNEIH